MIRKLFISLAIFVSLPIYGQINTDRMLTIGKNALYFEDYVLAIQYFNKVIRVKPYLADPYFYRGLSKYYLEDYNGAEVDLNVALEKNPFYIDAYNVRGIISSKRKDYESAIKDYSEGLTLEPNNSNLLLNRGSCKMAIDENESAIEDFNAIIKQNPKMFSAYLNRGAAKLNMGDSISGMKDFTKVIELNPYLPDGYASRGILYYMLKKYKEALKDYEKVIELKNDEASFYMTRGIIRYQLDDLQGTMDDFNKVIQLQPKNVMAYSNRGILRAEIGDFNRAIEDFSRVLALDPTDLLTLYYRAKLYNNQGLHYKALADLNIVLENYPDFGPAYNDRAFAKQKTGDANGANIDFQTAFKLDKDRQNKVSQTAQVSDEEPDEKKNKEKQTRKKSDKDIRNYNKIAVLDDFGEEEVENEEYSAIRGKVQNKNIFIDLEPFFGLTFYAGDSLETRENYYERDVTKFNQQKVYRKKLVISNRELEFEGSFAIPLFKDIKNISDQLDTLENASQLMFARGVLYGGVMNYSNSLNDYTTILEHEKDNVIALFNRAYSRHKMVEIIRSLEEEQANLSTAGMKGGMSPSSGGSTKENDQNFEKVLDYDLIIKDLNHVIELSPKFEFAYYNRAVIHCLKRDFLQGIEDFSKAIDLNPEFAEAYFNRGLVLIYLQKESAGTKDLSKAGELGIYKAYNVIKRYGQQEEVEAENEKKEQ